MRWAMNDHSYYEELGALAAGGHLSEQESGELREHLAVCSECRQSASKFRYLVRAGLPLVGGDSLSFADKMKAGPEPGVRERFLERARSEGVEFSPNVAKSGSGPGFHVRFRVLAGAVLALVVLVAAFYWPSVCRRLASATRAVQEANRLKQENGAMAARLAQGEQELATRQKEISELRGQLGSAVRTAENYRREGEQQGVRLEHSTSQTAQLADELQNREKQLAASTEEIARINQLRGTDKLSLVAEQARIKEISDQLRIADATLDMERQLSSEGRDIRALLVARQLHVVDVRDTDSNGKPSQAFARVFLTEGKSLMFFAFDLNEANTLSAKARFQVWGEQLGKKGSVRSLGVLSVDDKAQNRWALKVENPGALSEINSVFVTISPLGSSNVGQRLLYAYLGEPNHS
jgi:hypothetical protein